MRSGFDHIRIRVGIREFARRPWRGVRSESKSLAKTLVCTVCTTLETLELSTRVAPREVRRYVCMYHG